MTRSAERAVAAAGTPPPLSVAGRVGYGFGAVAYGVGAYALGGSVLQLYFNQVLGLPAVWVGAAIMLTILVDAVIDPLIGWWSDSLRSPWGRRHVLMYASAIPSALGVYLIWQAPAGFQPQAVFLFVVVMLLFVRVAGSFFEIPSYALAPELAPDYDERTSLFAWRFMFLILGGSLINAVLYQVFLRQDAANPLGVLNRERYADFGAFAAVVVLVAILVSTMATHSRIRYLHVPKVRRTTLRQTLAEFWAMFSNRPLAILMVTNLMIAVAAAVTSGLSTYMYLHLWRLTPQQMSYILVLAPFASFLSLWAAPRLSKRFGKKSVMLALYGAWLVTAVMPFSIWLLGFAPAAGSLLLVLFLSVDAFLGIGFAVGVHIVLNSMLADVSEDIAVKTGLRSEGVMFAAYGLLAKWGAGLGAFVAGLLLSLVSFPEKAVPGTVDMGIMRHLVMMNLPTITVFNLLAITCASFYMLDRKRHEENLTVLRARVAETHREPGEVDPIAALSEASLHA